ncbi:MAG: EbsA family protein [Enterococcus sp.]
MKKKTKRYYWQPELATAMIYWSITLMILFYSLTLSLENTRPYWFSNLVMVVFFVAIGLSWCRQLTIAPQGLTIGYACFWRKEVVPFSEMAAIKVTANHLSFVVAQEEYCFYFRKKTMALLLAELKEQPGFN